MTLLTANELAAALGMPARTVRHKLAAVAPETHHDTRGGRTKVFSVESLPEDLRAAWLRRVAVTDGLPALQDLVRVMTDPRAPSEAEEALFWDAIFQAWENGPIDGTEALGRRAGFLEWIASSCPWVKARGHSLYVLWCRRFDRWLRGDRKPSAFLDRRGEANRARQKPLPEQDKKALAAIATLKTGTRLPEAWRAGLQSDLVSEETKSRFTSTPSRKSYVPERIRRDVAPIVKALKPWHRGPRTGRLQGAWNTRDWQGLAAMDRVSADDLTPPVWLWVQDQNGAPLLDDKGKPVLTRGQALVANDEKTRRILDFCLLPTKSYSAFAIRTLFNKLFSRFGLPRKGLLLECGIWKNSSLLKGKTACPDEEIELGLRQYVDFKHTYTPRGKVIERILGLIQNKMEVYPGYIGRAEMSDKFERESAIIQSVRAGRKHPAEAGLLSLAQWFEQLKAICEEYNAEPMESDSWPGETLSPDEAWMKFQNRSDPPIGFPPRLRYLLAHHRRQVTVGRNGATVQFGKRKFVYRDEQTSAWVHRPVIVWFDPEAPEFATITDMNRQNPICVPLAPPVSYDASADEMEAAARSVANQNSYAKGLYSELRAEFLPKLRPVVPNWEVVEAVELGDKMREQRQAAVEADRARGHGRRVVTSAGLPFSGRLPDEDEIASIASLTERLNRIED